MCRFTFIYYQCGDWSSLDYIDLRGVSPLLDYDYVPFRRCEQGANNTTKNCKESGQVCSAVQYVDIFSHFDCASCWQIEKFLGDFIKRRQAYKAIKQGEPQRFLETQQYINKLYVEKKSSLSKAVAKRALDLVRSLGLASGAWCGIQAPMVESKSQPVRSMLPPNLRMIAEKLAKEPPLPPLPMLEAPNRISIDAHLGLRRPMLMPTKTSLVLVCGTVSQWKGKEKQWKEQPTKNTSTTINNYPSETDKRRDRMMTTASPPGHISFLDTMFEFEQTARDWMRQEKVRFEDMMRPRMMNYTGKSAAKISLKERRKGIGLEPTNVEEVRKRVYFLNS